MLGQGDKAPSLSDRRSFAISVIVLVFAASTSGLALIIFALGWLPLGFAITLLAPLTAVLTVSILVLLRGQEARGILVGRMLGGIFAGVIGLIAYDFIRLLILWSGTVPFNPFLAIENYGLMILGRQEASVLTKTLGWLFHTWNGISFAVMYTLAVGRGRVWWALVWALALEGAMVATYPSLTHMALNWPFVAVGVIGHVAYGLALGLAARGAVKR